MRDIGNYIENYMMDIESKKIKPDNLYFNIKRFKKLQGHVTNNPKDRDSKRKIKSLTATIAREKKIMIAKRIKNAD